MPENTFPQNITELIDDINHEWSALMQVVARLTPEQMTAPDAGGWSPKDNLAHLAEWMKVLLGYHMDRRPSHEVLGVAPEVTRDWDMDTINQVLFERNHLRPALEVLEELEQVYAEVIARLKSISFEELLKARYADDPDQLSLLHFVLANTSGHFAEHRVNIEKMLKE